MPKALSKTVRRGRPPSEAAESHAAILDAVYELLQETSARDLTMDAVAKRAKVGRPTLYKWWPTKSALVFAVFHERIVGKSDPAPVTGTAEEIIRRKVRRLIREFNGLFGKVMADLIAEGQSEPTVLQELWDQHMSARRDASIADIERGKAAGELTPDTDAGLLIDAIIAPIFFRLLTRYAPLSERFGDELVDQVFRGARVARVGK
jgi:AcrR family transcriptional regulator